MPTVVRGVITCDKVHSAETDLDQEQDCISVKKSLLPVLARDDGEVADGGDGALEAAQRKEAHPQRVRHAGRLHIGIKEAHTIEPVVREQLVDLVWDATSGV
jgi:hypothetical protein